FWHWALGADGGHGHAQPPFRSSRLIGAERQPTSDCRQSLQQSRADDYLHKPFAYAEFLARIRSLLRRAPRSIRDILLVADMEIDLLKRRVRRGDNRIDLTAQEFALLQLLAEREGEVLTRTFITSQIWDMNFDSDTNVVDAAIKRLRAKVDNAYDKKLIHTIRGMGYVLEDRS
ncbi:winged helix-turn-helix domain-containing protein, partial [Burkholderia vietnamiensis]